MKCAWFFVILFVLPGLLPGQETGYPFVRNYSPRTYQASSANYTAVQDPRGIMYFGNLRGVLEFDGANWRTIPFASGATVHSLDIDSLGTLFVGGGGDFGYLTPDSLGRLHIVSLQDQLDSVARRLSWPVQVLAQPRGAWFWGREQQQLYRWEGGQLAAFALSGLEEARLFSFKGALWAAVPGQGLLRWRGKGFEPVEGGRKLAPYTLLSIVATGGDTLVARTFSRGFLRLIGPGTGLRVESFATRIDRDLEEGLFSRLLPLSGQRLLVATVKQGAYVLNAAGGVLMHLDETTGLQDNLVLGGVQDSHRSLWLTLSRGISRVEIDAPLRHWGKSAGLEGIVFSVRRHQGVLYAATVLGVYRLVRNRFEPIPGIDSEAWDLVAAGPGQSRLLVTTLRGVFEIRQGRGWPVTTGMHSVMLVPVPAGHVYMLDERGSLQVLPWQGGKWGTRLPVRGLSEPLETLLKDGHGYLWGLDMHTPDQVYRWEAVAADSLRRLPLPAGLAAGLGIRSLLPMGDSLLFVTAQRGLWVWSPEEERLRAMQVQDSLPFQDGASLTRVGLGGGGDLWVARTSLARQWLEHWRRQGDGRYFRDSLSLNALANTEVWSNLYPEADGRLWIGTAEGLYSFDSQQPRAVRPPAQPLIRKVSLGEGQPLFLGSFPADSSQGPALRALLTRQPRAWQPRLAPQENALTFYFAAPYYEQARHTHYAYRLLGHHTEDAWSAWTQERKKDYTLLPPGDYEFQVKARNGFGEESAPASFAFSVAPPWYRSRWALLAYGVLAAFLIYGTVRLNTQRLHLQNEHLERLVYERTNEIWEQHKEIVKKTVALKRQKEAIASQHDLV
ncbi:MAG: hypothetical protein D6722_25845, partial [Bacteroidetes bacterium]